MNEDITYILAMSCVLPAGIGLYRYNRIHSKYHPFIYMMILTAVIETVFYIALKFTALSMLPRFVVNIYMLVNFFLFLYFVYINSYISKRVLQWLLAVAGLVCLLNFIYLHTFLKAFYYLLYYVSAVMLILSIDILSRQIIVTKEKLVNNFWAWFSSFSIIYNAFTLLIYSQLFFAVTNKQTVHPIANIHHFANLICYVFFAVAILKIPEKK
jgi:hypothetical protein